MPKLVDHAARRQELVDALLRVVVRDGIGAVSIRTVAAEAGCSSRPVQYYFNDKAELVAAAHARVSQRMADLITTAVLALGNDPSPRAVIETVVYAFLPITDEARDALVAYYNFYAAELTDPAMRIPNAGATPSGLVGVVLSQVERHRGSEAPSHVRRDVALLVISISTIASSVIAGYQSLEEATSLLRHQIDRLVPDDATVGRQESSRRAPRAATRPRS